MATWSDAPDIVIGKKRNTGGRSKDSVGSAMRSGGDIDTQKKFAAGSNKQFSASKNTAILDRETEELHHNKVSLSVSKLIQQGRQLKELTQKELATRINEKPQVINEYESGRAIPNQQVMAKLERALGMKLRGKEAGKPAAKAPKK